MECLITLTGKVSKIRKNNIYLICFILLGIFYSKGLIWPNHNVPHQSCGNLKIKKDDETHESVSRCLWDWWISQLCIKILCLFLGFKDFSNSVFSSFGIAPLKGFHIFVLKEDFYSNISFPGFGRKITCCRAFDVAGYSGSRNPPSGFSVFVCLFLLLSEWGWIINYWSVKVSSKFSLMHVMIWTN